MKLPLSVAHRSVLAEESTTRARLAAPAIRGTSPMSQTSIQPQFLPFDIPIPCSIKTLPCRALPGPLEQLCRKALGC
jgi:hypothetical protein